MWDGKSHPRVGIIRLKNRLTILLALSCCCCCLVKATAAQEELLTKGMAAYEQSQYAQAAGLLGQLLENNFYVAEAYRYGALALVKLDRDREALAVLEHGVAHNPQSIPLLMEQGKLLARLNRHSEAVTAYSQVIALNPKNAEAWKNRGVSQAQVGHFVEALDDLDRAAALSPEDPWVFNRRGMVKFCQGKYQEAVADFTRAIRVGPDQPLAYFFRGNVYLHHLHQKDKAMADYRRGCELGHSLCCNELEKLQPRPAK